MTATLERRATPRPIEFRAVEDTGGPGVLTGYAVVFDSESRDLGGWVETIDREAFGGALDDGTLDLSRHHRVIARSEHDSRSLLGTTDAGTLRLFVDDVGIRYEVDLPNTTAGRDAAVLAARGDYAFSSFAFYSMPDGTEWRENAQGQLVRHVTQAQLVDVAPVADPAYWGSSSELQRSFDLDAIRADLRSEEPTLQAVAPDARAAALGRAITITNIIERGHRGCRD
jgi:HK97 family phage prohead protease